MKSKKILLIILVLTTGLIISGCSFFSSEEDIPEEDLLLLDEFVELSQEVIEAERKLDNMGDLSRADLETATEAKEIIENTQSNLNRMDELYDKIKEDEALYEIFNEEFDL